MRVDAFDFDLPETLIALRPANPRRSARLLVAQNGQTYDSVVERLGDWLQPGDLLVFNDTKVIPARLFGRRIRMDSEARIEVTLTKRLDPRRWEALARPAKRFKPGDALVFEGGLQAMVESRGDGGEVQLTFALAGFKLDEAIARVGVMPLPPYIAGRRPADAQDNSDYQTIFAAKVGAVAAPTAALHFDGPLLTDLAARGVQMTRVTLHVGAGTFLPVKVEDTTEHKMHSEWGEIGAEAVATIMAARAAGRRVIAVGTTALRVLESAAADDGRITPWSGETAIFITPGYRFKIIDGLMTNFHLPRSTLFMLVSALMGLERMKGIYAHAIEKGYRFYSYGDSSLLMREQG